MFRFIFAGAIILLFIWRIHRGFANGIMQEVVNLLSGVISLICVDILFSRTHRACAAVKRNSLFKV